MLAKILKMPPAMGVPINRQLSVSLNGVGGNADIKWNHFHSFRNRFSVGFPIHQLAGNLFKAIYISNNGHAFEAVFSEQNGQYLCWYVRTISYWESVTGVSLMAIKFLTGGNYPVSPTAHLFSPPQVDAGIDWVVPVVLEEKGLWSFAQRVLADNTGVVGKPSGYMFKPLFTEEPQLLQALITGWLPFNPFYSPPGYYPQFELTQDTWFGYQEAFHAAQVKGMVCEINNRLFDQLTHQCVSLRHSKFSVTALMSAATHGHASSTWVVRDYHDPYEMMFPDHPARTEFQRTLDQVFYKAATTYCRLYQMDPDRFGSNDLSKHRDVSSITISRTIGDEVSFTFHDLAHDRHICFYSFYPLIAVSTLAAGSEIP